jgi:hypothetical protein
MPPDENRVIETAVAWARRNGALPGCSETIFILTGTVSQLADTKGKPR